MLARRYGSRHQRNVIAILGHQKVTWQSGETVEDLVDLIATGFGLWKFYETIKPPNYD